MDMEFHVLDTGTGLEFYVLDMLDMNWFDMHI